MLGGSKAEEREPGSQVSSCTSATPLQQVTPNASAVCVSLARVLRRAGPAGPRQLASSPSSPPSPGRREEPLPWELSRPPLHPGTPPHPPER